MKYPPPAKMYRKRKQETADKDYFESIAYDEPTKTTNETNDKDL